MLAANASFRASQADADRNATLRRLDGVVKNYAEVLKNNPGQADAAYNYEYTVRVRDTPQQSPSHAAVKVSAGAQGGREHERAASAICPRGRRCTAALGGPPPKSDMAQFKIVIPKRGEERKDDPQAGKGGVKVRKGIVSTSCHPPDRQSPVKPVASQISLMLTGIDLDTVSASRKPLYLWLLVGPAALLVVWFWQLGAKTTRCEEIPAAQAVAGARALPDLRRPDVLAVRDRRDGAHLPRARAADGVAVSLSSAQPGSTWSSCRTDRRRCGQRTCPARSMAAIDSASWRTLGESLAWRDDRIAMALFAHIAAPQGMRLTKDPNTFFCLPLIT